MVSVEIASIAALAEIRLLAEFVISCGKHVFQRNCKGVASNQACRKSLIFLRKYQDYTHPRPRHGAFHLEIADFYSFHGNRKNRGFTENRTFRGNRDFLCKSRNFSSNATTTRNLLPQNAPTPLPPRRKLHSARGGLVGVVLHSHSNN